MQKKGSKSKFCIYCDAEVKLIYSWKKIIFLSIGVLIGLIVLNMVMRELGWPGLNGGFAGGMGGAVVAVFMRREPFLTVELVAKEKKKRRN